VDAQADAIAQAQLDSGAPALIWRSMIADTETPVSAMLKLFEPERGDFILESVEGGAVRGRYSLIGLAPDLVFRAHGANAELNRHWLTNRNDFAALAENSMTALRSLVASCRINVPEGLPGVLACLVGYFGYETFGLIEKLPRPLANPLALPDMMFVRPTLILVFDRLADRLYLAAPVWSGRTILPAIERIEAAMARLSNPVVAPAQAGAARRADTLSSPETAASAGVTPMLKDGQYAAMVAAAKDYIAAGDIFQVVLAQRFTMPFPLPAFDLYRALRRINPSPFLYHLDLPGFALTGSSPEILVRARGGPKGIEVTAKPRSKMPKIAMRCLPIPRSAPNT
jgi:anthranilate synthase component I